MGLTKTEIFTDKQNKLAGMMKALAQSTISQHLKELKNAGLIQGTIAGTSVCYCIEPKVWALYQKEIGALFAAYKGADNGCGPDCCQ